MKASKEPLPDGKDNKLLKAYFEKVYPDLDFERVYPSDLKKMVKWYEVLTKNNVDIKLSEQENTGTDETIETENVSEPVSVATEEAAEKSKKGRKKKSED
jgi:hypothetical protein